MFRSAPGTTSRRRGLLAAASALTTPLLPEDFLTLVDPLWSTTSLRGRVVARRRETGRAVSVTIEPGRAWAGHRAGQYVGIGVQVDGRFQWRSYSISSAPRRSGRHIAITIRAMPEGKLSGHLVSLTPGTIVRLAAPEGDFVLPDPPPARMLFLVGGSGVTPVMAMLRLPTRQSGGKANLHQGAIGVGVDLATGITLKGTWLNKIISKHPDTTNPVDGVQLPDWNGFMHLAASCYELSGLGYIGVDLVLDQDQGPLILELNARPGLNIQIANDAGLTPRCHMVERHLAQLKKDGREESAEERVAFSQKHFAKLPDAPLSSDEANASNA